MNLSDKIVVTGASGMLGQNVVLLLTEQGYNNIVAIDKHSENSKTLQTLNPSVKVVNADLANGGEWENEFENATVILILHAQITSLYREEFVVNNVESTKNVLEAIKKYNIPYIVHVSSSVVISVSDDDYTDTKKEQEELVINSGVEYTVIRPPLMFGWFDKKHFGYLSRFMEQTPVFPIPGNGKFLRQPLYGRDVARVIISAMEKKLNNKIYNVIGYEEVDYIDIVREIKKVKSLKTIILKIPYSLFYLLMKVYAIFSKKPPFTTSQLKALTAGDYFKSDNWQEDFNVKQTPFKVAIEETFTDEKYSKIILKV